MPGGRPRFDSCTTTPCARTWTNECPGAHRGRRRRAGGTSAADERAGLPRMRYRADAVGTRLAAGDPRWWGFSVAVCPRRARCRDCQATHVLLPEVLWPRRTDAAEVIGAGLEVAAGRLGHLLILPCTEQYAPEAVPSGHRGPPVLRSVNRRASVPSGSGCPGHRRQSSAGRTLRGGRDELLRDQRLAQRGGPYRSRICGGRLERDH